MQIAVTGGAGFIGSHLCERLVKEGHDVLCIDNFYTGRKENLAGVIGSGKFELAECSIMEKDRLEGILRERKIEELYHYAAVVGVKRTLEDPKMVMDVNVTGAMNVMDAAYAAGCKKLVNISSSEVYGKPAEIPEREDSPKNVELPYAIAKLFSEKYAEYYQGQGLKTTSLRFFNVYGPRQNSTPYGFVVGIFIKSVLDGKPPPVFGDGSQTRDFTYIEDNLNATLIAGKLSKANGEVLNIGTGKAVTVLDLAKEIIGLSGKKLKPHFVSERPLDIKHRCADIKKMKDVLGYAPAYDLRTGLKHTMEWYGKYATGSGNRKV
jgi:UDP-glucose 4-epimerase